ncbi:MAG: LacI family DNA-binding transcriptional regulator [Propionicimonas sp.]
MARVTLQSIADEVGVSRMTVSNAFSKPDQLSDALRERIMAVADRLGYLGPDPSARSLATGTTGTIGVLWAGRLRDSLSDEVSARFLGAIADELAPDGLALTLLPSQAEGPVVPARDVAMDGAIAFSCRRDLPALVWLQRRGLPLVYVDLPGEPSVTIDDRGGARLAAQHLIDLGHHRIAIVMSGIGAVPGVVTSVETIDDNLVVRERLAGWLEALGAAGIVPVMVCQPSAYDDARPAARDLLARAPEVTGVLCLTDVLAHDVIAVAHELGRAVPGDLSVVGFDDHPLAARAGLTTVRQDVDAKGRAAAQALRREVTRRDDPDSPRGRSRRLEVELVVRQSTGPVRQRG